jgi:threonine aldolase
VKPVDLRSDTVTKPSAAMRDAMARAEVGDDVYGEDPTVNRLQAMAAELLGKEAALFVPSGTMANQIALRAIAGPGDAVIAPRDAHVVLYESGAAAALGGLSLVQIGADGAYTASELRAAVYPADDHFPRTGALLVENTHNRSGGRVFPFAELERVAAAAKALGLRMHMDGARLFNAEAATGIAAARWAEAFDTVSFCLSKGLGAPVGSLVAGSRALIERAHRFRKQQGGGMRQAGILAAAGIFALEQNRKRLADDHSNARRLVAGLAGIPGVSVPAQPETNIAIFNRANAAAWSAALRARGVLVNPVAPDALRAVTHLDVTAADIDAALEVMREARA